MLSVLMHPCLIPTYGMIFYMCMMHARHPQLPGVYLALSIAGTFVLTALIPIMLILLLWRRKVITSPELMQAQQRTTPYLYTAICFGFWSYFVRGTMRMPQVWFYIAIGATVALLAVTLINRWWKISAHLTALGGLLGGAFSISLYYSMLPTMLIIGILLVSLLLMYARLYLNAHTPMQVVCGYILGLICTFSPNFIIYHA